MFPHEDHSQREHFRNSILPEQSFGTRSRADGYDLATGKSRLPRIVAIIEIGVIKGAAFQLILRTGKTESLII